MRALTWRERFARFACRSLWTPPFDEKAAADLFSLQTVLTRNYTDAQDCVKRTDCRQKTTLYRIMKESRVPAQLLSAWKEWHDAAAPVRTTYADPVKLLNSGAHDFGQLDAGATLRDPRSSSRALLQRSL